MKSKRKNGMAYFMYTLVAPEQAKMFYERRQGRPPQETHIEGHCIFCGPTENDTSDVAALQSYSDNLILEQP